MYSQYITILFLTTLSMVASPVFADIYEYTDEAGVLHLSDVPNDARYVLVLKTEVLPTNKANKPSQQAQTNTPQKTSKPIARKQLLVQINQSAQNNQLDSELIQAVIHVESAFKPKATSHKGAQGLMQLMPATAKRFGVKNSYDPAQNIEGGAQYLRELLTLFNNNKPLAIAAYNAGENAVIKYGHKIPPYKETQAYVPKVLNIYQKLLKQRPTKRTM